MLNSPHSILLGKHFSSSTKPEPVHLLTSMATRHGLIAGATGTGKTVTLQLIAEQFSALGVPVFLADVKGDLSGLARPSTPGQRITDRINQLGLAQTSAGDSTWTPAACPVMFWDIFRKTGVPFRTTVSEVGPLLLGRLLSLNDLQQDVLHVLFKIADDHGLLLLDLKDLTALLEWCSGQTAELRPMYGNIAPSTLAAIQRGLIALGAMGGDALFGEPAIQLSHLMQRDYSGRGVINVLDSASLLANPRTYSTLLLWLMSELFESLPEVGDTEKPSLVFFFDEAHLLFTDAPPELQRKIEQVVKLIRSKGVALFFVTQNPSDIPDAVLAQLGNRIQHALRAYTPGERKAVKSAAAAFRPNPAFSSEDVITELGIGEALVSTLDGSGVPSMVHRTLICPPQSQIGPIDSSERLKLVGQSPLAALYSETVDRTSAHELLKARASQGPAPVQDVQTAQGRGGILGDLFGSPRSPTTTTAEKPPPTSRRQGYFESLSKSVLRSVGSTLGREVIRGILGSITRR